MFYRTGTELELNQYIFYLFLEAQLNCLCESNEAGSAHIYTYKCFCPIYYYLQLL